MAEPAVAVPVAAKALAPTDRGERIEILDILRGFALFGILLVNMQMFAAPFILSMSSVTWWDAPIDRAAEMAIRFLAQSKFYALFSFLFGIGMAMQIARAERRHRSTARFLARRMAGLLAIGLVHAFLVWYGDILVVYSIVGLLAILFRNRKDRTLLIWAVILILVPLLLMAPLTMLVELGELVPSVRDQIVAEFERAEEDQALLIERSVEAYGSSDVAAIMKQRASDVGLIWSMSLFFVPNILGFFLLGMVAGRRRIVSDTTDHRTAVRRALPWLLAVGILGNGIGTVAFELATNPAFPSIEGLVSQAGFTVGAPALCFFYAGGLLLLGQSERWRRRMRPLAAAGRTALSNYLLQSLVCTTLVYGYGAALYGRISPAVGVLLTVALFATQLVLSSFWVARVRFGPVEWLWRFLTYGRGGLR